MSLPGVGAFGSGTACARIDAAASVFGKPLIKQRRHRLAHVRRIGDVRVAHRIGEPRGFEHEVEALGPDRIEHGEIELLQDVEQHQRGQPLPVRRNFQHVEPAIVGRDRRRPPRRDGGRNPRAVSNEPARLHRRERYPRRSALRKTRARPASRWPSASRRAQAACTMSPTPGARPFDQIMPRGAGMRRELVDFQRPIAGDTRRDRKAVLGIADGRRQRAIEPERPCAAGSPPRLRPRPAP